jgi:hypothetical protein
MVQSRIVSDARLTSDRMVRQNLRPAKLAGSPPLFSISFFRLSDESLRNPTRQLVHDRERWFRNKSDFGSSPPIQLSAATSLAAIVDRNKRSSLFRRKLLPVAPTLPVSEIVVSSLDQFARQDDCHKRYRVSAA